MTIDNVGWGWGNHTRARKSFNLCTLYDDLDHDLQSVRVSLVR